MSGVSTLATPADMLAGGSVGGEMQYNCVAPNVGKQCNDGTNFTYDQVNKILHTGVYEGAGSVLGLYATATATDVASASTVAMPSNSVFRMSGTATISTMTPPAGFLDVGGVNAGTQTIIPTGTWSTTTGGNIFNAITAVVGQPITATYLQVTSQWHLALPGVGASVGGADAIQTSDGAGGFRGNSGDTKDVNGNEVIRGSLTTGNGTSQPGEWTPNLTTVANLNTTPPTFSAGSIREVSDGITATDCTTGGGSNKVACQYTGAAWQPLNNASGGSALDPADPTYLWLKDDLSDMKSGSSGGIGELGWGNNGCTATVQPNVANHPGIENIYAGGTTGNTCEFRLDGNGGSSPTFMVAALNTVASNQTWEYLTVFQITSSALGSQTIKGGLGSNDADTGLSCTTNCIFWLFDTSVSGNFQLLTCSGGTCTTTGASAGAITVALNTWYQIRIYMSTSGTVNMEVKQSTNTQTQSATTNIPSGGMTAYYILKNNATQPNIQLDYFHFKENLIVRY